MDYNAILEEYDLRFRNSRDIVATFLLDLNNKKYVKNMRDSNISKVELLKILQNSISLFSNDIIKSVIIEAVDWNIVFLRLPNEKDTLLYVVVAKKRMALGALLSVMKK